VVGGDGRCRELLALQVVERGNARTVAERIDLNLMIPIDSASSTGYALVNPNVEYLVYQPAQSSFTVTLPITALSSIYGMNIIVNDQTHLPQLILVLTVMAIMSAMLLTWAKRRGWW